MGYACPVCDHPQADATHLANHLAITAIARGGAHERWLDRRFDDWVGHSEGELAAAIQDHVDPTETEMDAAPELVDSPAAAGQSVTRADAGPDPGVGIRPGRGQREETTREILANARELTRRRAASSETDSADEE